MIRPTSDRDAVSRASILRAEIFTAPSLTRVAETG